MSICRGMNKGNVVPTHKEQLHSLKQCNNAEKPTGIVLNELKQQDRRHNTRLSSDAQTVAHTETGSE